MNLRRRLTRWRQYRRLRRQLRRMFGIERRYLPRSPVAHIPEPPRCIIPIDWPGLPEGTTLAWDTSRLLDDH